MGKTLSGVWTEERDRHNSVVKKQKKQETRGGKASSGGRPGKKGEV